MLVGHRPEASLGWRDYAQEAVKRGLVLPESNVLTFRQYADRCLPNWQWTRHCEVMASVMQRICDGELKRVIVQMPPRHGKSELASRILPGYFLTKHPRQEVGLGSYAADLAHELAGNARDHYVNAGFPINRSTRAKKAWRTGAGGLMWSNGVDGAMTGRGLNAGIVDDAFSGPKDAASEAERAHVDDWYRQVFSTRQAPGASIMLVGTRWHVDDLIGRVLEDEKRLMVESPSHCQHWHIVHFEAIKDDIAPVFPESCTVEPDWREPGEALCPERFPIDFLEQMRIILGSYAFNAIYQQKPTPPGGHQFKEHWFSSRIHIDFVPKNLIIVGGVDLAFGIKEENDFNVFMPVGIDPKGHYYLFRPVVLKGSMDEVVSAIASRARELRCQQIGIESVAAQAVFIPEVRKRRETMGMAIMPIRPVGDKVFRSKIWEPIAEQGLITLVVDGTGWEVEWLKEILEFPKSKHDDRVDGTTMAFQLLQTFDPNAIIAVTSKQPNQLKQLRQ